MSAPKSRSRTDVARWLEDHFIRSFTNEADPSLWDPTDDKGVFAITLLSLTYCYAAAGLVNGIESASSAQAIAFIRDWIAPRAGLRSLAYDARAAALFVLYRHGLAHQRIPSEIDLEDGSSIAWILGREALGDEHMRLYGPLVEGQHLQTPCVLLKGRKGIRARYFLSVQPDILYADVLAGFRGLRDDVSVTGTLAQLVHKSASAATGPRRLDPNSPATARIIQTLRDVVTQPARG